MPTLRLRLFLAAVIGGLLAVPALAEKAHLEGYAGTAVCAECHADETETWKASDHAWALKEPDSASMLGDFENAAFSHDGVTSRFFRKDGG